MSGSSVDIVISIILIYGIIRGFYRGFFLEVSALTGLLLGIYCAINFKEVIGYYLEKILSWEENYIIIVSFLVTLIIVVVTLNLIAKSLTKLADIMALGLLNKIAGAFLGLIKYSVICIVFVLLFDKINSSLTLIDELTILNSTLYDFIRDINQELFPLFF
ncbi:MAG: CvpA family protein, partial [Flavobacteriaceae bacterium]|nr:CvpA family protein [Flavobacteriaceae bacterium]MBT4112822.1 CvpA family protein [Flavobacteriaceae bacterium]MBT4613659.1 CvpA family protein [Flavobacteriaceae bacterium]MBT5649644.1 CvpA family protein [Flavobacteriaceae bacterium]